MSDETPTQSAVAELPVDAEQARRFLSLLADGGSITFQYFDDSKRTKKAGHFTRAFDEALPLLTKLNSESMGVYCAVNQMDGHGRTAVNVTAVRALFIDLDGSPIQPVHDCPLEPHVILESSPGRYQVFWLVSDCPLEKFSVLQLALARKFGGDESITDLPRVMRIPGFFHMKRAPFMVKTVAIDNFLPYELSAFNELQLEQHIESIEREVRAPLPKLDELSKIKIKSGERHAKLLKYASKYAHVYGLGELERKFLIEGINRTCCIEPITDQEDLNRINLKAGQYAEEEKARNDAVDFKALIEKHKLSATEARYEPLPDYLFHPPGTVGDTFRYILSTSTKPQPEIALAASFAAFGTIIGRRVRTETNLRSNLYFLCLGETGSGKDRPRRAIMDIFSACGAEKRFIEDVASDAAVLTAIEETPSACFALDEFGRMLKTVRDSKNAFLYNIMTLFVKMYGAAGSRVHAKHYADKKRNVTLQQPNISLLATSVERHFFEAIGKESIEDGLLNRMIFIQSTDPDPIIQRVADFDPPASLIAQYQAWEKLPYRSEGNLGTVETVLAPKPRIILADDGAQSVYNDFEADLRAVRKQLRPEGYAGLFARSREQAMRIGLILACSETIEAPMITADHAEYACAFVKITTENMLKAARENMSENRVEAAYRRVLAIIKSAAAQGLTLSKLGEKTRFLNKHEKNNILGELEQDGCIMRRTVTTEGNNKPTITVYYVKG